MTKTKVVIMAGGREERWQNHLGVHKHLVVVDGERLIDRIARLVRERMDAEITLVAAHTEYDIDGVERVSPIPFDQQSKLTGGANCSERFWSRTGRTIVLYGDVFFTEHAMDRICGQTVADCTFIGRAERSKITGCTWGELFGFVLHPQNHKAVREAIDATRQAYQDGQTTRCTGWEIYRHLQGVPLSEHRVCGGFLEINDFTDDFDFPADYDQWIARYSAHQQRRWWKPTTWPGAIAYARRAA